MLEVLDLPKRDATILKRQLSHLQFFFFFFKARPIDYCFSVSVW